MNRLPLHDIHLSLGAKMMTFGEWQVPLSYRATVSEHHHVRNHVGLFDVSHMGEIRVTGDDAVHLLQYLTINDVEALTAGQGQYTAMLNADGGFIDDLILYRLGVADFMLCVNAANTRACLAHITAQAGTRSVTVTDQSHLYCQFALQGPASGLCLAALQARRGLQLPPLKYMDIATLQGLAADPLYVARSGYTGERGYELYVPLPLAQGVWQDLLESGHGIVAIGFGARDTLRLEACYLLYGNDIDHTINPYEAGIGWAVKLTAKDFIGRTSLLKSKEKGVSKKIVAFKMQRGFPRTGMEIMVGDTIIGHVTSGSILPTVGGCGGLALLTDVTRKIGDEFSVSVRGKPRRAEIVAKPHYLVKCKE